VFADWDPVTMTIQWAKLPVMSRFLAVGVDYGTNNPTAVELLGLGMDARLYLVDEWRHDGRISGRWTDANLVSHMRKWLEADHIPANDGRAEPRIEWVIVDPSAASFQQECIEQRISRLTNADNRVLPGVQLTSSMLSTGRLIVSSKCRGFIEEAPGYSWDPDQTKKGKDVPIKSEDHSLDAARYALQTTQHTWRSQVRAA